MTIADHQSRSIHAGSLHICGLPPKKRLVRRVYELCPQCQTKRLAVRVFSGSGWYEDSFYCTHCGEDLQTLYHPFARGWRKKAIEKAKAYLAEAIPASDFDRLTMASIRDEMGWEE